MLRCEQEIGYVQGEQVTERAALCTETARKQSGQLRDGSSLRLLEGSSPRRVYGKSNPMKALILAGGQDVLKCPLLMVRPRALFPLVGDVLVQQLLKILQTVDVEEAVICANGRTHVLREHFDKNPAPHIELAFHDDQLPRGTAGCLGDMADFLKDGTFLVLEAGLFLDGDIEHVIADHARSGSAMTLSAVPAHAWAAGEGHGTAQEEGNISPLGLYVMEPDVLDLIPEHGFCDIKEQLIPKMRERRLEVSLSHFQGRYRRISDAHSYAMLVQEILSGMFGDDQFTQMTEIAPHVWTDQGARIDPSAQLIGPIVVGRNAVLGKNAVVRGPSVIGENVFVDDQAVVSGSILWPNATVGLDATVEHSIVTDSFPVSVFDHLSCSVAIDRELTLGDMHGLKQGGYQIASPYQIAKLTRNWRWPLTAMMNAWRSLARLWSKRS